jgi:hypothetical protein
MGAGVTVGEAIAVNAIWKARRYVKSNGAEEWNALALLARGAYKTLRTGVTPADVERVALLAGVDIRNGQKP